jgi:hypothetical protein
MINDSEQELIRLQSELNTHEVQCEERWKTTFNRLEDIEASLLRMENRQLQLGGAVILFLATLVATMVIQG